MPYETVASRAKSLLDKASRRLGVSSPLSDVGGYIDESLGYPFGERSAFGEPLSPSFGETTPETLSFVVDGGGPHTTRSDRVETATRAIAQVVGKNFGRDAARWLDGRVEATKGTGYGRSASYGASFGSTFDRNGVSETFVQ